MDGQVVIDVDRVYPSFIGPSTQLCMDFWADRPQFVVRGVDVVKTIDELLSPQDAVFLCKYEMKQKTTKLQFNIVKQLQHTVPHEEL